MRLPTDTHWLEWRQSLLVYSWSLVLHQSCRSREHPSLSPAFSEPVYRCVTSHSRCRSTGRDHSPYRKHPEYQISPPKKFIKNQRLYYQEYLNGKGAILNVDMTGCLSELTTTSNFSWATHLRMQGVGMSSLVKTSTFYHLPTSILAISLISGEHVMKNFADTNQAYLSLVP